MKKKDIIQLVKDAINEVGADAYGDATLTSQGQSKSRFTKTGRPPGVMEFKTPKTFDPDTINLVREMLYAADVYHDELVDDADTDEISSFLDSRSGGTYIKFPHFNGPQGRGAMFGKETTDQIDRSKAKAKAAALKTYTQFKTYIEDYEITDVSPAGVYGNIYLFLIFNDLAKDYTAPKGGTQSSQFEEINEAHPLNKVIGGRPYSYIGGPMKGQYVLSGPMDDREKETIIRGAKQAGYTAKPNMGGGVTIFIKPPAQMEEDLAIQPERLKKVFDAVNNSRTPDFFKNRFRSMYGIEFPENLKDIDQKQAISMNKFMNDLRNNIKETKLYTVKSTDGTEKQVSFSNDSEAKDAIKHTNIKSVTPMEELDLTNDIGKDDYVDDEGRYAKSQLYKMAKYSVKLHQKLDDMEQLPAWLQAKLTKALDYVSMVYHYLDYEMVRRDSNLMEEMDEYKKNMFEEPNEGNAFAVARLKAIKAGEDEFEVGGKKHKVTDVSDDDKKAAEDI